jgi:hypothetical protein
MSRTDSPRTQTSRQKTYAARISLCGSAASTQTRSAPSWPGSLTTWKYSRPRFATLAQENETLTQEPAATFRALGGSDGTGHRPGRERPQPSTAIGRLVDR